MPLYEYECEACGVRFEQIQKFSDPHVEVCPTCGGVVHKLMSLPSIRFKGSGWYVTDYAQKGRPADTAEGDSSTKSVNGGKNAGSADSGTTTSGTKASESTEREKSSPSGSTSSSSPSTSSPGSSSSDS